MSAAAIFKSLGFNRVYTKPDECLVKYCLQVQVKPQVQVELSAFWPSGKTTLADEVVIAVDDQPAVSAALPLTCSPLDAMEAVCEIIHRLGEDHARAEIRRVLGV